MANGWRPLMIVQLAMVPVFGIPWSRCSMFAPPQQTAAPADAGVVVVEQKLPPGHPLVNGSAPKNVVASGKREEASIKRETLDGHRQIDRRDRLPDATVMRVLDGGRAGFVRCFKKADPTQISFKITVHVELDGNATIKSATSDATDPALSDCLVRQARRLAFPATGRAVVVDLPLFYRVE